MQKASAFERIYLFAAKIYTACVYLPLLALLLLGASSLCATAPSSAGTYGFLGAGGPPTSESVTVSGNIITVRQALGDRMFTVITTSYDAKTLAVISMNRDASCCGTHWLSRVTRNTDGTYDIEAQMQTGKDVYRESRPHFAPWKAAINAGGFFIVPWMYHVAHTSQIVQLSFSPIRTDLLSVEKTAAAPYPGGVPSRDDALLLKSMDGKPVVTLWYDPCTFTLDAYGSRESPVWLRSALL